MDSLIENNQFSDFIPTMINNRNDELLWDVWVHLVSGRLCDKTFNEFKDSLNTDNAQVEYLTEDEVKTTINKSKDILSGFTPR